MASSSGIVSHFRGLVRNVESTRDKDLPPAPTRIADIDATDAEHFLERISGRQKLILHLSEGTDAAARAHFEALHLPDGRWAISPNLLGIHCVALKRNDFKVMAAHGGSMVWSPLSNLLLYGATANIGAALDAQVPIALGSDWAPSGSKNLLGELKVARIAADDSGVDLSVLDLVRTVTTTPAAMLGWGSHLGSLEQGKRADLIVVNKITGKPYEALIEATEADLNLVMINGIARVGTPALMESLGPTDKQIRIDGKARMLNLQQTTADTDVAALTVAESINRLEAALVALPDAGGSAPTRARPAIRRPWLAVADVLDNHMSSRPHLPLRRKLTGPNLPLRPANEGLGPMASRPPEPFPALSLDPLAAVDNPGYYAAPSIQPNLPKPIRTALAKLAPN